MSGAILHFEGSRHAEAQRLLPWLANGTLAGEERARVVDHVAACAGCLRELNALRALQAACVDEDVAVDATEAGWRRLRGRLGARAATASAPVAPPRWLGWTLAAQAALVAVLAVALWQRPAPPAPYRTLGATPATGNLVVVFDPRLDEVGMRRLLHASDARIVDGPNDAGAYVLAVPPARVAGVRAALRAAPGVSLVESLAPEPREPPR